jgi:poly(3-hydroxybutyrate) depolymerase
MDEPDRITARPSARQDGAPTLPAGLHKLPFATAREGYLFVPASVEAGSTAPLALLLHGAGGHAHDGLRVLLHLAERAGLILVAPASQAATWTSSRAAATGLIWRRRRQRLIMRSSMSRSTRGGWRSAAFPTAPRTRCRLV